jgi:phage terminase large subunit
VTVVALRRRIPRWALPLQPPSRYKGASGGRGSGKSHFFAEEAVERMVCDPSLRVVCIREVQKSLKFSAKALVEHKIRELGVVEHFTILETEIRRIGGSGLMIFQGMQDHTAESIKSLEGFGIAWVEEAQSISQASLDLLLPTIRAEGSEIWCSWNPKFKTDAVDVFFAAGLPDAVRVHTTYRDNPFLPSTLRAEAARLKESDPDKYAHIWGGSYDLGGKGRVYPMFLDKPFPYGNIDDSIADHGGELLIGQDFNINPMASVLAQRVVDECHILDAWQIATSNTTEVCEEVRRRYPNRRVIFCPDPAGNQRRTSTQVVGQTDFTIIRSFGFEVRAPAAHPAVVDRINNANAMYYADDRRRVRVHPRAMPLIESLSGFTYKTGTSIPDKRSIFGHIADAADYLLWQEFNVLGPKRTVSSFSLMGS